ncbi:MAG: RnfH family protein [Burkholderiales bacterium]|nr:RnfH family protein [Burkholderiales bacterium]MDE2289677.1 RnfH family protein [Burkholderiales bacterium]MDE2608673.1 RnfH family protein [Burkholderiales bacterium]
MPSDAMQIQVCYAQPDGQTLLELNVPPGATIEQAIRCSGVLARHPEIDLERQRVGIFGQLKPLDTPVQSGDRIEIYRPLKADPKEARQRRVAKKRAEGSREGNKWQGRR